jgi:hypothetical protein
MRHLSQDGVKNIRQQMEIKGEHDVLSYKETSMKGKMKRLNTTATHTDNTAQIFRHFLQENSQRFHINKFNFAFVERG